jgi:hypothetical protein
MASGFEHPSVVGDAGVNNLLSQIVIDGRICIETKTWPKSKLLPDGPVRFVQNWSSFNFSQGKDEQIHSLILKSLRMRLSAHDRHNYAARALVRPFPYLKQADSFDKIIEQLLQ